MDEEAAKRGTTVYLVDKRIDMLPSLLGTSERTKLIDGVPFLRSLLIPVFPFFLQISALCDRT